MGVPNSCKISNSYEVAEAKHKPDGHLAQGGKAIKVVKSFFPLVQKFF
jgi:hypothetical protein